MDKQAYLNLHWSFNLHTCMFSPNVVHFFSFFLCFIVVMLSLGKMCNLFCKRVIHVLHLTMFR